MKELIEIQKFVFKIPYLNWTMAVNPVTLVTTWVIILFIIVFFLLLARSLKKIPGRPQLLMELIVGWFDGLLKESMARDSRKFLPFIISLFLFVLLSNWSTVIPRFPSPTKDINTCLGLGILVLIVAHGSAVKKKGLIKYLKSYLEPVWFLLPSNIFSEISKVLSHSFRLFGNIFAGGIVLSMVPFILWEIFKWWGLPINILGMPVLNMFFGLFIGTVQAFIFTMLAIAYISVLREN